LDCYYLNNQQEAICPGVILGDLKDEERETAEEELKEYATTGKAVPRVIVPYGQFKSYTSKQDANNLAAQYALA
jgi:hypothetical protein